jgi:hypothetical protein
MTNTELILKTAGIQYVTEFRWGHLTYCILSGNHIVDTVREGDLNKADSIAQGVD